MCPCSSTGLVTQAWRLTLYILMMMPGTRLQAQKNNKETVMVTMFYKEPHMNGCTKCHDTVNRRSVLLQCAAVQLWHIVTENVFLAKFWWMWKSRTSFTNFTNQGDKQIKKTCPHLPQSLTYSAVGKTIRWLRKKALRKHYYLPDWHSLGQGVHSLKGVTIQSFLHGRRQGRTVSGRVESGHLPMQRYYINACWTK